MLVPRWRDLGGRGRAVRPVRRGLGLLPGGLVLSRERAMCAARGAAARVVLGTEMGVRGVSEVLLGYA